jgi:hypothetical protein
VKAARPYQHWIGISAVLPFAGRKTLLVDKGSGLAEEEKPDDWLERPFSGPAAARYLFEL